MKKAFTLIELIIVIIILGILASIVVSTLIVTKEDADLQNAKLLIKEIKQGINSYKNEKILEGESSQQLIYPSTLDKDSYLFGNILPTSKLESIGGESKVKGSRGWGTDGAGNYYLNFGASRFVTFNYCNGSANKNQGKFLCISSNDSCDKLGEVNYNGQQTCN